MTVIVEFSLPLGKFYVHVKIKKYKNVQAGKTQKN